MPRPLQLLAPAVLFSLLAAFAPPAMAAHMVPFSASITFAETITPGSAPCFLVGHLEGAGTTSLGPVQFTSQDCINLLPPNFVFASTSVVLTTASGDALWAAYTGTVAPDGSIMGGYAVYGGTGRFAHARGAGTIRGMEDLGGGLGSVQLQGTLRY